MKLLLVLVLAIVCAAVLCADKPKPAAKTETVTLYDADGNAFQVPKTSMGKTVKKAEGKEDEMSDEEFEKLFKEGGGAEYKVGDKTKNKKNGEINYEKEDFEGDEHDDDNEAETLVVVKGPKNVVTIPFNGTVDEALLAKLKDLTDLYWVKNGQSNQYDKSKKVDLKTWFSQGHPADKKPKVTDKKEKASNIPEAENKVVELTDADIKEKTKKGTWVIMFYAEWCDYCKKVKPTWNRLANVVDNVARANADTQEQIGKEFKVEKFPTLIKFENGKFQEYSGQSSLPQLIQWAKQKQELTQEINQLDPDVQIVDKSSIWEVTEDINALMFFYSKKWADKNKDTFKATRARLQTLAVGFEKAGKEAEKKEKEKKDEDKDDKEDVHWMAGKLEVDANAKVLEKLKGLKDPAPVLVVFQNSKYYILKYDTPVEEIQKFVKAKRGEKEGFTLEKPKVDISNVIELTDKNFESKISKGRWLVMFYAPWCGFCKKLMPAYGGAATALKDNAGINVAKIDGTQAGADINTRFKIDGFPTLFLIENGKMIDAPEQANTAESLQAFAEDKEGHLASGIPVPGPPKAFPKGKESDIITLHAKNLKKKISKGKWIIKIYANWCQHCKTMIPMWRTLATYAKKEKLDTKIAKFDADDKRGEFDPKLFKIEGLPTILLIDNSKKGKERVQEYTGKPEMNTVLAFLNGEEPEDNGKEPQEQEKEGNMKVKPTIPQPTTSSDISLTGKNFWSKLSDGNVWLVKVYAPWCGGCKDTAADWEKLAIKMKDDKEYKIANVNGDIHESLIDSLGVEGFPTIYKVKGGKNYIEYEGDRTEAAMEEFLKDDSHEAKDWKKWGEKKSNKKDDL